MKLDAAIVCDRGLSPRRPINEDRGLALTDRGIFVVCDGIGGHSSGEVASQLAVDTIEEALEHFTGDDVESLLEDAVRYANRDIFEASLATDEYFGMGTTIALLHVDAARGRAVIGHAGDSRVYRFDGTSLQRETYDHTDVDDLIRSGRLSHEQALRRGKQNTINRALGIEAEVQAEFKSIPLREGDAFLLCSDGVNRHLADDELEELFQDGLDPRELVAEIKRRCYARGAEDNLTAIVVTTADPPAKPRRRRSTRQLSAPATDPRPVEAASGNGAGGAPVARPPAVSRSGRTSGRSPVRPVAAFALAVVIGGAGFLAGRMTGSGGGSAKSPSLPAASAREAFDRGDFPVARAAFAKLSSDDPQRGDYHYWLGRSLLETNESREAVVHLEEAARLDPAAAECLLYLAVAYEAEGRSKEASETLRRYVQVAKPGAEAAPAAVRSPGSDPSSAR